MVLKLLGATAAVGLCAFSLAVQRSVFGDDIAFAIADWVSTFGLRSLDPETAHNLAVLAASWRLNPRQTAPFPKSLETNLWGIHFPCAIGIAAGFDKDAEAIDGLLDMGCGFVEVGSITPLPQTGNPRPRVFRLAGDDAVINRYGFNSCGLENARERLLKRWLHFHPHINSSCQGHIFQWPWCHPSRRGVVGVNLGKNKDQADAAEDYCRGINALSPFADYIVINVSSPNTPGLRKLQGRDKLAHILHRVRTARDSIDFTKTDRGSPDAPPLLIKIAPDLSDDELKIIVQVALAESVDGIVVTNTTVDRPSTLTSQHREQIGGLSGKPLREKSTLVLSKVYKLTGGKVPLIGVGGVMSGVDAYTKIRHGASLVQVYTGMTLHGPGFTRKVANELASLLARDGFTSVTQAVGIDIPLS
eukprot:gene5156-7007_t